MKLLMVLLLVSSYSVHAKVVGRLYFQNFLGHVHKNPSKDSSSLTAVQCSHSVKLLEEKNSTEGWSYVEVGEDKGYIQTDFLDQKRPDCFQMRYPKFYLGMDLDITDMYYWGKLYDHYLQGKSKVK